MKKGRVQEVTRPQPTLYGNCDSWSFIVGRNRQCQDQKSKYQRRCDVTTNNLSTRYQQTLTNKSVNKL